MFPRRFKRIKDITRGQGAELVLDMVGVNPTLTMAAQVARVLGHLTIVGLGKAALPVNFGSPAHECSVASPYWSSTFHWRARAKRPSILPSTMK